MDIQNILKKVDALFEENKAEEAERLMLQSAEKAVEEGDDAVLLQLLNELIGYYREISQPEMVYRISAQAIAQAKRMGLEGTIPYATTLLNTATAYRACGNLEESLDYYNQVQAIYDRQLPADHMLMAGLKNNISLLYQEMGNYAQAKERQLEALAIAEKNGAAYECAVTYANLAGTCMQLGEREAAYAFAMKSAEIFRQEHVADSHFAAALSTLGACCYHEGDFVKARDYYAEAMETVEKSLGRNAYYERLRENFRTCEREAAQAEEKSGCAEPAGQQERVAGNQETGLGMRLARKYYETYGKTMIERQFPEYTGRIAVGLAGRGSDCFGYDDAASRDHDWGPDFCMWVTDDVYEEIGTALQEAYETLPREMDGYSRATHVNGRNRRGVIRISDFYRELTGAEKYEEIDWRSTVEASLAAVVNGEIFRDEEGIFTAFREQLKKGYPEEIRYLKLAESAARFAQTLQYNYPRMSGRGDGLTAHMMLWEGIKEAMKLQHYIEGKYPPHDKWLLRSLQESAAGREIAGMLEEIAGAAQESGDGAPKRAASGARSAGPAEGKADVAASGARSAGPAEGKADVAASGARSAEPAEGNECVSASGTGFAGSAKREAEAARAIERLAGYFAGELYREGAISDTDSYLDAHSEELVYKASLAAKSREVLAEEIARLEFEAFDKVKNEGGRASCQNDWGTFSIMRKSQYLTWNRTMLRQYLYDFYREYHRGHNLIEEKYGRMMESTAPEKYEEIKSHFPELSEEKKAIIEQIVGLQVGWMEEFSRRYPALAGNARYIHTYEDTAEDTSYETYLRGELGTYSDKMLELYGRYIVEYARSGKNPAYDTMSNSVKMYGYSSAEDAEEKIAAWQAE